MAIVTQPENINNIKIATPTTKQIDPPRQEPKKQIPDSHSPPKKNDLVSLVVTFLSGVVLGLLGYLYTKRNISMRFNEVKSSIYSIHDVKTDAQMMNDMTREAYDEINEMLMKREEALAKIPHYNTKFEDAVILKLQRLWNNALLALGQQVAHAQEIRRENAEIRLRERIVEEAQSQGYEISTSDIKKIVR
jgi:hypothetical protein